MAPTPPVILPLANTNAASSTIAVVSEFATTYDSKWSFEYHPKSTVHKFEVDFILGSLIEEVRKVDPKAYIKSWNDSNPAKLWSQETFPQTDKEMESYVEDPHTTSAGKFGKLYGRFGVVTDITLDIIKADDTFATWIRSYGLFIDISDIPSTRPTLIGFFNGKVPHATRIGMFTGFLKSKVQISRPFQIFSQSIYAGNGTDTKCFAYVIKSDYKDADIIVQELSTLSNVSDVTFHSWKKY